MNLWEGMEVQSESTNTLSFSPFLGTRCWALPAIWHHSVMSHSICSNGRCVAGGSPVTSSFGKPSTGDGAAGAQPCCAGTQSSASGVEPPGRARAPAPGGRRQSSSAVGISFQGNSSKVCTDTGESALSSLCALCHLQLHCDPQTRSTSAVLLLLPGSPVPRAAP